MKEFYIDFTSYTVIKAENREQEVAKFWEWIGELQDKNIIGTVDLDGIEERME